MANKFIEKINTINIKFTKECYMSAGPYYTQNNHTFITEKILSQTSDCKYYRNPGFVCPLSAYRKPGFFFLNG